MLSNVDFDDEIKFLNNIGLGLRRVSVKRSKALRKSSNTKRSDALLIKQAVLRYYFLCYDVLAWELPYQVTRRIQHSWIKRFADQKDIIKPSLFGQSVAALSAAGLGWITSRGCVPVDFKHLPAIKDIAYEWLCEPVYAIARCNNVAAVRQLCEYLSRIKLTSTAKELKASAIQAYVDAENEMQCWLYPDQLTSRLREIISEWLPLDDWKECCESFCPTNGPGAPAGATREIGANNYWKYNHMVISPSLFKGTQYLPSALNAYFPRWCQVTRDETWKTCELVYVPKTAQKLRSISKEPPSLQYLQHGWCDVIYKCARRNSFKHHVDLSRQELSADLALRGSKDGSWATLDLSAASDSVTLSLVKAVFPDHVRSVLLAVRSTHVRLPKHSPIRMDKYAPMGSCLCFLAETIVFAAICELAARIMGVHSDYRVYGDDIVIEAHLADITISLLTALHFTVNMQKSYWSTECLFREACGLEAYAGTDITPLRLSRHREPTIGCLVEPGHVGTIVDEINEALRHGLLDLRHWLIIEAQSQYLPKRLTNGSDDQLLSWIRFDESGSGGIKALSPPTNWKRTTLNPRYRSKWIDFEAKGSGHLKLPYVSLRVKSITAETAEEESHEEGWYRSSVADVAYWEWLRSHSRPVTEAQISTRYDTGKPVMTRSTTVLTVSWA